MEEIGSQHVLSNYQYSRREVLHLCSIFWDAYRGGHKKGKYRGRDYRRMARIFKEIADLVAGMDDMPAYLKDNDFKEGEIYPDVLHPDYCLHIVNMVFCETSMLELKKGRDPKALVKEFFEEEDKEET